MKRTLTPVLCTLFVLGACTPHRQPATPPPAIPRDEAIERRVEQLLSSLTLEEKVGQMCELNIDAICNPYAKDLTTAHPDQHNGFTLNDSALHEVFGRHKVGSILNVPNSLAQTPEAWATAIRRIDSVSMQACSGIPQLYGVDQIHGATYTWGATFFPQEINQAASFNSEIPRRVSEVAAYESRACLIPWVYSPVLDLGRNPAWPRLWESYGEDVCLNAVMGAAAVRGYQGDDPNHIDGRHVAACLKHYLAYGTPLNGRDRTPSWLPERELREKYLEPFRQCVRAGALSVMVNSGVINGLPVHANRQLLTGWLKEELNWDGMIVTDWADIDNLWRRDHVAATRKDAIALAINAGIDMSMDPYSTTFCDFLLELVDEGRVPTARIDDAVRRILRLKLRLGLLDTATWDKTPAELAAEFPDFGSEAFADEATRMAEECIVLLKNQPARGGRGPLLPLRQGTRILVCGPGADNFRAQSGGWSYSWQGEKAWWAAREIGRYETFYEAIARRFGHQHVTLVEGVRYCQEGGWQDETGSAGGSDTPPVDVARGIAAAVRAAAQADVVVAVVGENSYCETPGNIDDLRLSAAQRQLVAALTATGKPVVLVLNEGRPRVIADIEPQCAAVIDAMLPSNYGGRALANIIAGDVSPSARLPFTYPRHTNAVYTYDYKPCENRSTMEGAYNYDAVMDVQWPFGHGLSYTTFVYSHLRMSVNGKPADTFVAGDSLLFTVDVTNTGTMAAKEAVLLYVADAVASITPDNRRLRAFAKVELQPGQTRTVSLPLLGSDLSFVGYDGSWVLEEGAFRAKAGTETFDFECRETRIIVK